MQLDKLFVTPFWVKKLNLNLEPIKNLCREFKNNEFPNRVLSNVGGWQSSNINLNNYDELEALKEELDIALEEVSQSIHPNFRCRLDNVWININEEGHYNSRHVHPGTALAGTFYVQTPPDSGNIVFFTESHSKHYPFEGYDSELFHNHVYAAPEENALIIFPSWVEHSVEQSKSQIPRISISFNIAQIKP